MSYFDNCERSEGDRGVRGLRKGSVPWNNEEHSSFLGDVVSCRGVGFGIRGVERRLKKSVQSHGMR